MDQDALWVSGVRPGRAQQLAGNDLGAAPDREDSPDGLPNDHSPQIVLARQKPAPEFHCKGGRSCPMLKR
jgi:hypothetical protein